MDSNNPDIIVVVELRVDASRLRRTFQLLGFDEFHFFNVRGFSGGIIVAWSSSRIRVAVMEIHFQFIHLEVTIEMISCGFLQQFMPIMLKTRSVCFGTNCSVYLLLCQVLGL